MKTHRFVLLIAIGIVLYSCNSTSRKNANHGTTPKKAFVGEWIRMSHIGAISYNFRENGTVEIDFGNNFSVDAVSAYELHNDTIRFLDKMGQSCEVYGVYKILRTEYYLAFDVIDDDCSGRVKMTLGFWTTPEYKKQLKKLNKEIDNSRDLELLLNRARINLAMGKSNPAKADLDNYILKNQNNARAYVNRAGTRFPYDLKGVILDCNKAIAFEPDNKNAFFLRGLAHYELGEQEQGCADFKKAVDLGFSVLRFAEQNKCAAFWQEEF